nr:NFACT family protein [Spirochaetaceae bacterium]
MSLNYKEINVILEELALGGSRIDKINQPDRFSLYLETYGNKRKQKILISLTHGAVRIHRIHLKPEFPPTPPRFTQLLRARIKGGRIISLSQPENERILQFIIQTQDKIQHLWCRLWSGNPNLILTDENFVIIDTLFRKRGIIEFAGEIFNPDFSLFKKNNKKIITVRTNNSHENFNDFIN